MKPGMQEAPLPPVTGIAKLSCCFIIELIGDKTFQGVNFFAPKCHLESIMLFNSNNKKVLGALVACSVWLTPVWAQDSSTTEQVKEKSAEKPAAKANPKRLPVKNEKLDRSGKPRQGKASYYANSFAGKKMADGTPMNPNANIAASRTLPLGTKVEVTNLENGKSEVVEVRDRGPYVEGRIVDVSPKVAEKLDMKDDGVASVVVKPIELPPDDSAPASKTASSDTSPGANTSGN
jgi:rare lipoprotein A